MRLIGNIDNQKLAFRFSHYLRSKKIEHQLETSTCQNWGSEHYGNPTTEIWIINEKDTDQAQLELENFKNNPDDSKFTVDIPTIFPEILLSEENITSVEKKASPPTSLTLYLIFLMTALFVYGSLTTPAPEKIPLPLPTTPLFAPKINKALLYDYPKAFNYIDQVVKIYGLPALTTPSNLPTEGKELIANYFKTPWWHGFYPVLLNSFNDSSKEEIPKAPLFEKIRSGELWRVFTPALLHNDIFHLLFNMLWLLVLGKQMEDRLPLMRYVLFILVVGCLTNTFQYLMTGPNFIGFSGILSGMLTFIWTRQKRAPWEGYLLQKATFTLLMAFILAVFGLQVLSFLAEAFFHQSFNLGIANTAHISGALVGLLLGRLKFFNWRTQ